MERVDTRRTKEAGPLVGAEDDSTELGEFIEDEQASEVRGSNERRPCRPSSNPSRKEDTDARKDHHELLCRRGGRP